MLSGFLDWVKAQDGVRIMTAREAAEAAREAAEAARE
jgi:hypothetical protein